MTTIGHGPCLNCGFDRVPYKVNKKQHLYAYCPHPADGGCGSGTTSRSDAGDRQLAKKVTKWSSSEERKKWLDEQQPPEPAPQPDPDPENELEEEEEGNDPPPPPPRKQRRPAPPPPPPPRKKAAPKKPAKSNKGWGFPWE